MDIGPGLEWDYPSTEAEVRPNWGRAALAYPAVVVRAGGLLGPWAPQPESHSIVTVFCFLGGGHEPKGGAG